MVIKMLKRLSLYTLLLLMVPFFAWVSGWHWQGDANLGTPDHALYWLTETGSSPYALLTCAVFAGLYFWLIPNKKQAVRVIAIMACAIALTQGMKSGLKLLFAEPRPFISALAEQSEITTDYFYDQTPAQREQLVSFYYADKPQTPDWLVRHRMHETGYSFPSGHTLFAAAWLMLAVGFGRLLGEKSVKMHILTGIIAIWALLMLISRLRLGMHYPIDLFVSVITAWLVHCLLFGFLAKKAIFRKETRGKCG
ncbi:phosphatase PAP2 family protein [Necropsobacter rosorum]|uniref:phosphatase PAP2 family protein n=2 Tax=Pasteurellaceae TaxID=712 RepID=UPI0035643935